MIIRIDNKMQLFQNQFSQLLEYRLHISEYLSTSIYILFLIF